MSAHVAHLGDFDSAIPATGVGDLRPITTNSFAAPEEREGGPLDARSDLYSLGGVLYVVATGARVPERSGSFGPSGRTSRRVRRSTAELLSESPDDRPADAETVLERLNEIRYTSNIDALISSGESDKIEFKSSLHHPYEWLPPDLQKLQPVTRKEIEKLLRKSVTKTIAAFLNSDGGTLLIGVADSGIVLGIEPDFEYLKQGKQNADGWLLSLQEVIINALGAEVWNAVRVSLVPHGPQTVAVVSLPSAHDRDLAPRGRWGAFLHPSGERDPRTDRFEPAEIHPRALACMIPGLARPGCSVDWRGSRHARSTE